MTDALRRSPSRAVEPGHQSQRRGLLAACAGNVLEWFDWLIYAQFATLLAVHFFPQGSGTAALLGTLAIFGAGFFFRPLGGIVLAALADRRGRRIGLVATMTMMAGGSALIGLTPTYEQIGILAPVLLFLARALQGMSAGGEYAGVGAYLSEMAPKEKRGLYGTLLYITSNIGALSAIGVSYALSTLLGKQYLNEWGWRIPFILGAVLGVVVLYLRRRLSETEVWLESRDTEDSPRNRHGSVRTLVRDHKTDIARLFILAGMAGVWYYTFSAYLPVFLTSQGLASGEALAASAIALVAMTLVLPIIGALSDRFGRRPFVIAFAIVGVLAPVPLFATLAPSLGRLLVVQLVALVAFALYAAIGAVAMTEQFPTAVRAIGSGVPYAFGVAALGGTAPFLIEWLSGIGALDLFPWYLSVLGVLALVASWSLREGRDADIRSVG